MKEKIVFILLIMFSTVPRLLAQDAVETLLPVRQITLDEAINLARAQSVDAAVALNELKSAYWQYRTYRAELLPEINFNATVPNYRKSYSAYQLDDGSYTFVRNNVMEMSGELSIDQNIWLTGGTLSLNTSLDYLQMLEGDKYKRFMSVPLALTLNQPILGVNSVKWDRRIEPVRYEEAKANFITATEQVAMTTINYFFNLLMARESLNIARQNMENARKLYEVAVAKRKMGQISENDLLQLELNKLNAQSELTDCESSLKSNMFQLRSFLGIDADIDLAPIVPGDVPDVLISYDDVLAKALANNAFSKNIRRRQLEADYSVARAKGNLRQINLFAQIGYTGTADRFKGAYDRLKDNQIVQVGFKIPILDWGRRRGSVKVAESDREVVESRIRQETMDFNQNIFILVERFNNQQQQVNIASLADTIAQRRYNTNVETFMIGKISTLDLNDSQVSKDESRKSFINELYLYWYYYYQLRSLTLWDFAGLRSIDADIERIVKQ
ncbi:MAG: TolC family protein [Muribaculum sp.]|nr:TolC family protein [Muribaculum sp.]